MKKQAVTKILIMLAVAIACNLANAQAPVDDWQTLALWHMDSTGTGSDRCGNTRTVVMDDNSVANQGRATLPLILGQRLASCSDTINPDSLPTVVSGIYGNALEFDQSKAQYAYTNGGWPNLDDVIIEMYFYPTNFSANQSLLSITNSLQLRLLTSGAVRAYVWDGAATLFGDSPVASLNQWNHLVVTITDGQITASIDGAAGQQTGYEQINDCHHPNIYIGAAYLGSMLFDGLIDEVKISNPKATVPGFISPYEDDYNTFLLLHFDEILEISPRRTPDDDSFNPGRSLSPARNLDAILLPESMAGEAYTGPELVDSFSADPNEGFKKCFKFDGFRSIKVQGVDQNDSLGIPEDNFRIELWAKHNAAKLNDGYEYYFFHQADKFRFSLRDLANGTWGVRFVTWGPAAKVLDVTIADPTKWHHYAFEFYQGLMNTYIDGVLAGSTTAAFTEASAPIRALFIGSDNNQDRRIIGEIDEFRISRAVPQDPECGMWGYSIADLNQDCYVDIEDLKILVSLWLTDCGEPGNPDCEY